MKEIFHKKDDNIEILIRGEIGSRVEAHIAMPVTQTKRKISKYSKFYYINCLEVSDSNQVRYNEQISFIMDSLTVSEVKNIYNFIVESLKKPEIKTLKDCIKLVMSTFGRVLGLTYEKIVGLAGELLLVDTLFKKGIDISAFFHERDNMLYDFYFEKSSSYLEVKSTTNLNETHSIKLDQLSKNSKKTSFITVKFNEDSNGEKLIEIIDRILENKNFDYEFLNKLGDLRTTVEPDLIAQEHCFDTKNIDFKLYVPEVIQKNISILSLLSENKNWNHIEKITLDLNLSGIISNEIEDIKEMI
ncbi:hypothetical protein SSABA_v1c04150 [Spiroplasma sabaudiense Ar-1343]|uniref:PD-(D/E)XK motif protein n=1 Tax=Spiroplasma sabaudiense Ar-1343 TaxID=1276257 RepID=W6AJD1_9MOLU|nr:PD-(D/E)XK motif protein [Spiroplasma sabaudiense]AHI53824.1 hypothetical protein SSABA_v1c04150 [Spiroplasma sabaudiense Ar-1343]